MAPNFDFIKKAHWRVIFYQIDDRLRIWAYGKKNAIQIPSHGEQGFITIAEKYGAEKKILTFPGKGNIMKYNGKLSEKLKSFQIWEIGYPDDCIAMIAVF